MFGETTGEQGIVNGSTIGFELRPYISLRVYQMEDYLVVRSDE